jgi:hypothetical protein
VETGALLDPEGSFSSKLGGVVAAWSSGLLFRQMQRHYLGRQGFVQRLGCGILLFEATYHASRQAERYGHLRHQHGSQPSPFSPDLEVIM